MKFREALQSKAAELQQVTTDMNAVVKPPLLYWSEVLRLGKAQCGLDKVTAEYFLQVLKLQGRVIFHRQPAPNGVQLRTGATTRTESAKPKSITLPVASVIDEIVILDATWFNKVVLASIITTRHKFATNGIISAKDLRDFVWRGVNPTLIAQFLALLEKYEVLFPCDELLVDGDIRGEIREGASSADGNDFRDMRLLIPSQLPVGGPTHDVWGPKV